MTERKIYLLVVLFFSVIANNYGNNLNDNQFAESYITGFTNIAVSEMEKTGIPASIILAQGMLESYFGQSELASVYNNHFGVKCHQNWEGKTVQIKTNEYTKEGLKKENHCFRAYQNPEDSYRDHSDFLQKRDNYKFLFTSGNKTYKYWAQGLQKAKYATDPNYAKKLIELIEQYNLQKLDKSNSFNLNLKNSELKNSKPEPTENRLNNLELRVNQLIQFHNELYDMHNSSKTELVLFQDLQKAIALESGHKFKKIDSLINKLEEGLCSLNKELAIILNKSQVTGNSKLVYPQQHLNSKAVFYLNGKMATILDSEHTIKDIAHTFNISFEKLLRFNDLDLSSAKEISEGAYIFLELKAESVTAMHSPHVVKEMENMHYLAQRYGIKLEKLYKINRMVLGEEPLTGEFIFLDKTVKTKPLVSLVKKTVK
jgi:hypothetical protein